MARSNSTAPPHPIGQAAVRVRRAFALHVEPHIPTNKWFTWKLHRRIGELHAYEATQARRKDDERWLSNHAAQRFSQHGEDGIIEEIRRRLGIDRGTLVEFGAADGSENCTRALVEDGWSGVWIEGDPEKALQAKHVVGDRPVSVVNAFITKDNICQLLRNAGAPEQLDVLVVDIDGNDYWVLSAILESFTTKIIALEYNAGIGRGSWVMPYNAEHSWAQDLWHGASLAAFAELLLQHEMMLVGTDPTGINAFFVHTDEQERFAEPGNVAAHYAPSMHNLPYGHPWRHEATELGPISEDAVSKITVADITVVNGGSKDYVDAIVQITNKSDVVLASSGGHPFRVAAWWGPTEARHEHEPERFPIPWPIPPGQTRPTFVRLPARANASEGEMHVDVVQEGVRWLGCDLATTT